MLYFFRSSVYHLVRKSMKLIFSDLFSVENVMKQEV